MLLEPGSSFTIEGQRMAETVGTLDLVMARELLTTVVDALELDAYLFDIEPGEGVWIVKIECAAGGGWERVELSLSNDQLRRASGEIGVMKQLSGEISERLRDCKRRS
jgi:hypothetical protein